jgi:hypothetical protein
LGLHFKKSKNKKYILVPNADVGNFSSPKIIKTLNPLNLLLFTFQNLISINQEKLIIKHGQKSIQTPILLTHTLCSKEWRKTIMKARTPTM